MMAEGLSSTHLRLRREFALQARGATRPAAWWAKARSDGGLLVPRAEARGNKVKDIAAT